ncbi:MAG: protein kinase [Elusimicrobiota bacterium]
MKPALWVALSALLILPRNAQGSTGTVKVEQPPPEEKAVVFLPVPKVDAEGSATLGNVFALIGDNKQTETLRQNLTSGLKEKGLPLDAFDLNTSAPQPGSKAAKFESEFLAENKGELLAISRQINKTADTPQEKAQAREVTTYLADVYVRTATETRPDNYRTAIQFTDTVVENYPDDTRARTVRAQANLGLGRHEAAIEDTSFAVERNENDERAYMLRALAYYQMKNYTQAMEDAKRTLAINPNNQTAFRIAKLSHGRITKAEDLGITAMQKAASKQIEREYKSMLQQRNQVETQAPTVNPKEMQARAPGHERDQIVDSLNVRAQSKIKMGDPHAAIKLSNKVLQHAPENPDALYARAAAENLMGQYENAVEDATAILHRDPNHHQALDARSLALINLGRFHEAMVDADKSMSLKPESAYSYKNRAMAKEGLGDIAGMIADYKAAARLSPQFETDLKDVADKYQIALDPAILNERAVPGEPAPKAAKSGRNRRFVVVLASSITGGLLIAIGLVHILLGGKKDKRVAITGAGTATAKTLGGSGLDAGFTILKEVGHGGMGIVYEAMDKALDRKVAIKKMRDEIHDDARQRERFLEEARIVARLHHPNIVDIHNIIEEDGDLYMIFEYVEGSTIDQILAKKRRLTISEAQFIVHGVTNALSYAHTKGVIHRDLKPSNIMITKEGVVKVMDFGIARQAQDAMAASTKTNTVAGTPHYMAPEQEQGIVRKESDIFALGACLYEMLTGERPYASPATTDSKINKRYQKASRVAANLPPELDALIDAALEPDPEKRIQTASEFRSRLDEIKSSDELLA